MTNGSSQGLFVVVAVIIFGIFVAISYSLFRDALTPSLASIFSEHSSTLPAEFYLPDTPKGKEYHGIYGTKDFEEFIRVYEFDLSNIGNPYSKDTVFELTFSIKASKEGKVQVYTRSGVVVQYFMEFESTKYKRYTSVDVKGDNTYETFSLKFKLLDGKEDNTGTSPLSFYSTYDTANKITVKDISVRTVGTLK